MEKKRYSIEELSEKTGFSIRTIRYYIQEGLLEPPPGRGRGGFYFDSHLKKLVEIKSFQEKGLKLAAIQEIFLKGEKGEITPEREIWVKYAIKPGIEIHISRELEDRERKRVFDIVQIARSLLSEGGNEDE
jgi:DNA-binding transcriptional MerR regulator